MPTRAELLSQIRLSLTDKDTWPDATINAWIADAIRFYSAEFPRTLRYTLTLTTGTQEYVLPANHRIQDVLEVEYPTGQDPEEYLARVNMTDPAVDNGEDVYCLLPIADTTASTADDDAGSIKFGPTVATGEFARITYTADHATPTTDTSQITVPPRHWEALIAYCEFRSHWHLETLEAVSMTTVTLALAQLSDDARRAWNRYKEVIDRIRYTHAGQMRWVDWSRERIY